MQVLEDDPGWVVIGRQADMRELAFQKVDPYVPPRWPDGRHPNFTSTSRSLLRSGH